VTKPQYTAIRFEKRKDRLVICGLGRSARGTTFWKKAVEIPGDTKSGPEYRNMIEAGLKKLDYPTSESDE
jgi:hypothetical protein